MTIFNQSKIMNRVHGGEADVTIIGKGEGQCSLQSWVSYFGEHSTGELEYPILALKLSGHAKIRRVINAQVVSHNYVMPGDLIIVPSKQDQTWRIQGEVGIAVLTFDNKEVCDFLDQLYLKIINRSLEKDPFGAFTDPVIYAACKHLLNTPAILTENEIHAPYVNTTFRFLEMYITHYLKRDHLSQPLIKSQDNSYVIDYTLQRLSVGYCTNLHIEDIAKELRISPSFLAKKFKEQVGISPHQFLLQLRLKKAKELLIESTLEISEIAYECGFTHQSHLTRHFTKHVGTPPSKFRALIAQKAV